MGRAFPLGTLLTFKINIIFRAIYQGGVLDFYWKSCLKDQVSFPELECKAGLFSPLAAAFTRV